MDNQDILILLKNLYKELQVSINGHGAILSHTDEERLKSLGIDTDVIKLEADEYVFGRDLKDCGVDLYTDMNYVKPLRDKIKSREINGSLSWLSEEGRKYKIEVKEYK
jgi:hypothetical protein